MKVKNVHDSIELALAFGIDTTGETSRNTKTLEGIKTVSSNEHEAFRSALKQCDKNSKVVIFDALSGVRK